MRARKWMDIDELGLDANSIAACCATIIRRCTAAARSVSKRWPLHWARRAVTLEDVCEPYLMQIGMLTRTPRGRCVTRLAYEHLHMAVPRRFDEDDGQQSMF